MRTSLIDNECFTQISNIRVKISISQKFITFGIKTIVYEKVLQKNPALPGPGYSNYSCIFRYFPGSG